MIWSGHSLAVSPWMLTELRARTAKEARVFVSRWELSTMPSAWTMSTVEAAIFLSVVLGLAGAGAWMSVVG
jgi:hypothetical protein